MTKFKTTSKTCQNVDFEMEQNYQHFFQLAFRSLLCIRFVVLAFSSEEDIVYEGDPRLPSFAPS